MAALLVLGRAPLTCGSSFYSLIPRAITSPPSSSSVLLRRFLPFSTSSEKSSAVTCPNNISEIIEGNLARHSNQLLPLPSGFPFQLGISSKTAVLTRTNAKEASVVSINGNGSIQVYMQAGSVRISSVVPAKPDQDQLQIHEVTVWDQDGTLHDHVGYLHTKGITPETVDLLYYISDTGHEGLI